MYVETYIDVDIYIYICIYTDVYRVPGKPDVYLFGSVPLRVCSCAREMGAGAARASQTIQRYKVCTEPDTGKENPHPSTAHR